MLKYINLILISTSFIFLSGCTTASKPKPPLFSQVSPVENRLPLGTQSIVPNVFPKVGYLYFTGEGRRKVFATNDGVVYNSLCYDDFSSIKALSNLKPLTNEDGEFLDKKVVTQKLGGKVGFSLSKLKIIKSLGFKFGANLNRTYTVSNGKKFSLLDRGIDHVKNKIGNNCRELIKTYKKQGKKVVILLSVAKAAKITDITGLNIDGNINYEAAQAMISANRNSGSTETYSDIVLGVDLVEF